ncbi:Protein of unknown function DUF2314 [Cellulophaga algicola DSM 14237]|uniref:DUF2314 domain-containing protein n=1 Tax=Cellulophaga algicola (strain DSM 14237 / IC166 / ACAM 630) TaxID=688270 RepID=E6X4V1_CELAD|nr:DUF2314 domain-containing protein [Cellulophaga algicola]ADV50443.1 Protein of unknown function DUF2314 [Cellulophaga algicola DSM 14237]
MDDNKEKKQTIFYIEQNKKMREANLKAQETFNFFWRELYWEARRIVPAHDFAMIKVAFTQQFAEKKEPTVEHMWVNNLNFDGAYITGELVNEPHQLTNVSKGDLVTKKINEIGDWMLSIQEKTYGGFTIHAMRSEMDALEREKHDNAWGLNFGDFDDILLVYQQKEHPENLIEHPMSKNMGDNLRSFIKENPNELTVQDENGLSLLHREAIAGNVTTIEILLELGADKNIKSKTNKTALDYAQELNWQLIEKILN